MSKTYEAYAVHENGDRTIYAGLTRARALARYGQFTREVREKRYGVSGPIKSWGWRLEARSMSKSPAEIKAIAYSIADEIETRAQPLIAAGMDRDKAVMLTVLEMGKKLIIVKG